LPDLPRRHEREDRRADRLSDALVVCPAPPFDAIETPNPVIVVEVLSPSTAADDHGIKLDGHFALPSVAHCLVLDADRRVIIDHRRAEAGATENRVLRDGLVPLDPPGFDAEVATFFPEARFRLETARPRGEPATAAGPRLRC
jgi:hypothetical protein